MQAMQVGKMYINVYIQDLNDKKSIFTKYKAHLFQLFANYVCVGYETKVT